MTFQKTLEPVMGVASVGSPVEGTSTIEKVARVIPQAAEAAAKVAVASKNKALDEGLRQLGSEIVAAEGDSESALDRGLELEKTSDRFRRLKKARAQGVMGQEMIDIETEKVIKEIGGRFPAIASEVRAEAARILKFDPTGSEIRAMFGRNRDGSTALTREQKIRAQAEKTGELLGIPADTVERNMYKAEYAEVQLTTASSQLKLGEISSNQLLDTHLQGMDGYVNDAYGSLLEQMDTKGGVLNPEESLSALSTSKEAFTQKYFNTLRQSGVVLSTSERSAQMGVIDERFGELEDLFGDQATMHTILTRQREDLASLASIVGFQAFPGMAAIKSAIGERAVSEYLSIMNNVTSPEMAKLLIARNPTMSTLVENKGKFAETMSNGYMHIMGRPLNAEQPPSQAVLDTLSAELASKSVDAKTRDANLLHKVNEARPFKDFGDYGKKGVRHKATPAEVKYIKEQYALQKPALINRIADSLENHKGVALDVVGGKIKVVQLTKPVDGALPGMQAVSDWIATPSELNDEIKRLNSFTGLINNGWSSDLEETPIGYAEGLVNEINGISEVTEGVDDFNTAIENASNNLSDDTLEQLRIADPEAYADALRSLEE